MQIWYVGKGFVCVCVCPDLSNNKTKHNDLLIVSPNKNTDTSNSPMLGGSLVLFPKGTSVTSSLFGKSIELRFIWGKMHLYLYWKNTCTKVICDSKTKWFCKTKWFRKTKWFCKTKCFHIAFYRGSQDELHGVIHVSLFLLLVNDSYGIVAYLDNALYKPHYDNPSAIYDSGQ